jgi:hypothetical protein
VVLVVASVQIILTRPQSREDDVPRPAGPRPGGAARR